jgi:hypothetical protein
MMLLKLAQDLIALDILFGRDRDTGCPVVDRRTLRRIGGSVGAGSGIEGCEDLVGRADIDVG